MTKAQRKAKWSKMLDIVVANDNTNSKQSIIESREGQSDGDELLFAGVNVILKTLTDKPLWNRALTDQLGTLAVMVKMPYRYVSHGLYVAQRLELVDLQGIEDAPGDVGYVKTAAGRKFQILTTSKEA